MWLIDLVTPFGGVEKVIADLRSWVFKGCEVKTLRPGPGGAPVVETWPAAEANKLDGTTGRMAALMEAKAP